MPVKRVCAIASVFVALLVVAPAAGASAPTVPAPAASVDAKVSCTKLAAAFTDLSLQYQKLLFLDSAEAWATTARDPLGGTLDGAKLRADAKTLAALKSVKTSSLGFPSIRKVLTNVKKLGNLVDEALASSAPFPGPGEDAYDLATERNVEDRAAIGYAMDKRGCSGATG